ncbi:methionine aminopeptidase [Parabacteroides merdae CAG:48]|nr:methionine aminopeptidase [Parabacteroides merdae CAG:48]
MHSRRIKNNWHIIKGQPLTELDKKVLYYQNKGHLVPSRKLIKTAEQIEGIRRSSVVNTGVLDLVAREIKAGMSTAEIDKLVYDYTVSHGAIPAPLNYEGFPKSVCTSVNEVVCHGIPSEDEILEEGDIINVDVSTILDGYYSDASRMFIIGKTTPEKEKLVRVTKEGLEIGMQAAEPFGVGRRRNRSVLSVISAMPSNAMRRRTGILSSVIYAVMVSDWSSMKNRRSAISDERGQGCFWFQVWYSRSNR